MCKNVVKINRLLTTLLLLNLCLTFRVLKMITPQPMYSKCLTCVIYIRHDYKNLDLRAMCTILRHERSYLLPELKCKRPLIAIERILPCALRKMSSNCNGNTKEKFPNTEKLLTCLDFYIDII